MSIILDRKDLEIRDLKRHLDQLKEDGVHLNAELERLRDAALN